MHFLTEKIWFPDPSEANSDGLLAVGGDLSAERLRLAYSMGIFPWYESGQPVLWWSPDPRMVLFPSEFRIPKSLRKVLKSALFHFSYDAAFEKVIHQCAVINRKGQSGTWITDAMQKAYLDMHEQGLAHSVEVWQGDRLVGGLYGVDLKEQKVFCGESMFSKVSEASKAALFQLAGKLNEKDYKIIDCQVYNPHLERLGAREISRSEFLEQLHG